MPTARVHVHLFAIRRPTARPIASRSMHHRGTPRAASSAPGSRARPPLECPARAAARQRQMRAVSSTELKEEVTEEVTEEGKEMVVLEGEEDR